MVHSTMRDPIYDAMKAISNEKFDYDRAAFMSDAISNDDGKWTKHTDYHWSRTVAGSKLDYWPSRKKWQYLGKVKRGDVYSFINARERPKCQTVGGSPQQSASA